ncbi:hypothetical protein vseg_014820 [Gypsophila vaccaria]
MSQTSDTQKHFEEKNFVKLFVGSVPSTATEEQIRPLFEEQGKVLEVALIKDKRTRQQQGLPTVSHDSLPTIYFTDMVSRAVHGENSDVYALVYLFDKAGRDSSNFYTSILEDVCQIVHYMFIVNSILLGNIGVCDHSYW